MSLFRPRRADQGQGEQRQFFPVFTSSHGANYADVNLHQAETSLQKVAVWSAVDLITSLASELPLDVYRGTGPDRELVTTGHPWLEDPGADGYGLADWISQLLWTWLLRGNGVGTVLDKNPRGDDFPTAVELHHPDRVKVTPDGNGRPVFSTDRGPIPPRRLFHRRVYPVPGQVMGLSPIAHHAATIGLGLSITNFGRQWFTDGAHPGGLLTNTEVELNKTKADEAKARFMAGLRGTREPVVLGKGWQFEKIQIAPEESQFLESNQFTSAECARIFGPGIAEILGYESGGSMTYSNVEQRSRDLLVYTMNRWLRRVDRVLTSMLPRGQYARLNRDAMLQSTTLERYRVHQIALRNRIHTPNEVRAIEDEPPVSWGDEPLPIAGASGDTGGDGTSNGEGETQ